MLLTLLQGKEEAVENAELGVCISIHTLLLTSGLHKETQWPSGALLCMYTLGVITLTNSKSQNICSTICSY